MRVVFFYGSRSVAVISIAICKAQVCGPRCHAALVSIFIRSLAIVAKYSNQRRVFIFFNLLTLLEFHISTSKVLIYLRTGKVNLGVKS